MTFSQLVDLPPVWLLAMLLLTWAQTQLLPALTVPFTLTSGLGVVLVLCGIGLMFWAVAAFRQHQTSVVPHQTPDRIITSGPFTRSRNPIYLGDVLVLGGAILWWGAWPALVLIPVFVFVLTRRFIAPEEARMKESFGELFDDFAEKTPRWL
ncbi:Isoprenylcysteine carboxyl methyltransferase family protein [Sulfitobacter noctilucicola]|nr:Isoprenylcysteine carboxyl methyltransferase family protein [Sulfitobacter noctilucicola]